MGCNHSHYLFFRYFEWIRLIQSNLQRCCWEIKEAVYSGTLTFSEIHFQIKFCEILEGLHARFLGLLSFKEDSMISKLNQCRCMIQHSIDQWQRLKHFIEKILPVCTKYMKGCPEDENLVQLVKMNSLSDSDLNMNDVKMVTSKFQRISYFRDSCALDCLNIFQAMLHCETFCRFVECHLCTGEKGKQVFFYVNTILVQHENEDIALLNNLKEAFEVVSVVMDHEVTFSQLMTRELALYSVHLAKTLYTVNARMDLIYIWLSRAEVSIIMY